MPDTLANGYRIGSSHHVYQKMRTNYKQTIAQIALATLAIAYVIAQIVNLTGNK